MKKFNKSDEAFPKTEVLEKLHLWDFVFSVRVPFCVCLSIIFFLLVSCASAPKTSVSLAENGGELNLLPSGGRVYLWADAVGGRPLLDAISFDGKSTKDASNILDVTSSAAAVFFPEEEANGRKFFIAALGDYPSFRANFSFALSRAWKKQKSKTGSSYWYSANDGIALSLGSNMALVSNVDPLMNLPSVGNSADNSAGNSAELSAVVLPPEGFDDFRRSLVLAGWMNDPSESINTFLEAMGIPIKIPAEEFLFGAAKTPAGSEPWELVFKIKNQSAAQARAILTLFSIARLFVLGGMEELGSDEPLSRQEIAALLFANTPELDGLYLSLRTGALNEGKIALLFEMFSLYSK